MFNRDWQVDQSAFWQHLWRDTPMDVLLQAALKDESFPKPGTFITKDTALNFAVLASLRGVGFVKQNPLVGAIICDENMRFLSWGAHEKIGGPHAERQALSKLSCDPKGSKIFVTLEPCGHHGKTPPCTEAILQSGIAEVTYIHDDPNPLVSGKGLRQLRDRGVHVQQSRDLIPLAANLMRVFLLNQNRRQTYFAAKMALTPEGVYGSKSFGNLSISNARSRSHSHVWRQWYDSIMIGPNTLKMDLPRLNVRSLHFMMRQPDVIVFDPKCELEQSDFSCLLETKDRQIWLVRPKGLARDNWSSINIIEADQSHQGQFIFDSLGTKLMELGLSSVLIEGGGGLWKSALESRLVSRIHLYESDSHGEEIKKCNPSDLLSFSIDHYTSARSKVNGVTQTLDGDKYHEFDIE
jgi:diaminohydroxyphosphoribosylaminopyrimidine deaminase / 5-amino-6-(5-phosphoribosylamino)uracil reductase